MKIKIKICGLNSIDHIETAVKVGAFWYGMIFYEKSPRNISLKNAKYLIDHTPKTINPVAIVVDPSMDFIKKLIDIGIKNIQLHGSENISFCEKIKNNYKLKVIKAINVREVNDVLDGCKYTNYVDWILYDSILKDMPGGTGHSFNWDYLKNINLKFKWILSGGLNYSNVIEAIQTTKAIALDVSSGIELKPGKKSNTLIEKFVNSVKIYEEKNFA